MKAFGVRRNDQGCCPDHDKYPNDNYGTRFSKKQRSAARHAAHSAARARARQSLIRDLRDLTADDFPPAVRH